MKIRCCGLAMQSMCFVPLEGGKLHQSRINVHDCRYSKPCAACATQASQRSCIYMAAAQGQQRSGQLQRGGQGTSANRGSSSSGGAAPPANSATAAGHV